MIKAKEAKVISQSTELDQQILDKISFTIIREANKGNYCANITSIIYNLPHNYIEYLKELHTFHHQSFHIKIHQKY